VSVNYLEIIVTHEKLQEVDQLSPDKCIRISVVMQLRQNSFTVISRSHCRIERRLISFTTVCSFINLYSMHFLRRRSTDILQPSPQAEE